MPRKEPFLDVTLPSDTEIRMTRIFDAPRDLVFQAFIDPDLIPHWWGPRRYTTTVDHMDVRPGGSWRFIQHDDQGNEFAFRGEFREIRAPERLVQTFEFEPMAGHISVETATFENLGERTRYTTVARFDSKEDRDGMLESGMEEGARESWERFQEILAKQKAVIK